jgi:hypothetical protein
VDAEEEMSRAQLTYKVISESGRKGLVAEIVRAMLDPDSGLCVWRGTDGALAYESVCPDNLPTKDLIVSVGAGSTLELTYDIAKALGMKEFNGGAAELGAFLGLEGWAKESDYGEKTMVRVTAARLKAAQARQASVDAKIAKNNSRRQTTETYISHNIQEAAKWDPTKASYEKYNTYYNWGWGWGDYSQGKYTVESQKKWKNRTDATMYYISCAAKGLKEMKTLDAEAVKLGLEPMYKPGEIDTMYQDLNVQYVLLGENRDKTGD